MFQHDQNKMRRTSLRGALEESLGKVTWRSARSTHRPGQAGLMHENVNGTGGRRRNTGGGTGSAIVDRVALLTRSVKSVAIVGRQARRAPGCNPGCSSALRRHAISRRIRHHGRSHMLFTDSDACRHAQEWATEPLVNRPPPACLSGLSFIAANMITVPAGGAVAFAAGKPVSADVAAR